MIAAILGTVVITVVALVVAVPLGLAAGTWLHEYGLASRRAVFLRRLVVDMSGVPSVVYGLFGVVVFIQVLHLPAVIAAGLTLGILVLPGIVRRVERALDGVSDREREAALALGATHFQVVSRVVLPHAKQRVFGAVVLGLVQAFGEAAPLIVLGCASALPVYLFAHGASAWPVAMVLLVLTLGAGWWADQLRRHG